MEALKMAILWVLLPFILSPANSGAVIKNVTETSLKRSKRCYPANWTAGGGVYQGYNNWCQSYYPCYPYQYDPCRFYYPYATSTVAPTTRLPPTYAPTTPWPTYIVPIPTRPPYVPVGPTTRPPYIPVGPTTRPPYIPVGPTTRPPYIPVGPTTRPPYIPVGPTTRPPYIPVGPTYIPVRPTVRPTYIPVGPTYIPIRPTARPTYIPVGPTYIPVRPTARPPFKPITRPPHLPTSQPYISERLEEDNLILNFTDKEHDDNHGDSTTENVLLSTELPSEDDETEVPDQIFSTDLPVIVNTLPIPENDVLPDHFPSLTTRPPYNRILTKAPKANRLKPNGNGTVSDEPIRDSSQQGCKTICVDNERGTTYCCDNRKRECPIHDVATCKTRFSSSYKPTTWCIFDSQCPADSKCCFNDCTGDYQCETVGMVDADKAISNAFDVNERPHRQTKQRRTKELELTTVFPVRGHKSRIVLDKYIKPVAKNFQDYIKITLLPIVTQAGDSNERVIADGLGQVIQCASKYYSDQRSIVTFTTCLLKSSFTKVKVKPTEAIGATRKCGRMAGQQWKPLFNCMTTGEGQRLFQSAMMNHRETLDIVGQSLSSTSVLDVPILVLNRTVLDSYWAMASQNWLRLKICQKLPNDGEDYPVCRELTR
ncbi:uncharacterized protein [Palaemon carinicauda]|uniref:uncharacterized protein n=1 Tax=Palaemon carinicauda TaxID=392227 RepID=UPI0035B602CE